MELVTCTVLFTGHLRPDMKWPSIGVNYPIFPYFHNGWNDRWFIPISIGFQASFWQCSFFSSTFSLVICPADATSARGGSMILLGMLFLALIELLCQGCAGAAEVGNFPMKNGGFHGKNHRKYGNIHCKWKFWWVISMYNMEVFMGKSSINGHLWARWAS